ncbi:MAG: VWA domain-containing protein [Thermoanaerobaculia bacterium]
MPLRAALPVLAAAVLSFLLAGSTPLRSQEAPGDDTPLEGFGETVSVEVVNVEVWVTDRQGRPVTGLTRDDFELLEDGEPVEVRYLAELPADAVAPGAGSGGTDEARGAPEGAPGVPEDELLHVVVYVDDWNLRPEDRSRVLDDLRGFLARELRPGERVMVVLHDGSSLSIAQPFTDDLAALGRSLDRIERQAPQGVQLESDRNRAIQQIADAFQGSAELSERVPIAGDACTNAWPDMESVFRAHAATVTSHAQGAVTGLSSVLQNLAGVPGSKVLLYVGNGLPDQAGIDLFEFLRSLCPHLESDANNLRWAYDLNSIYSDVVDRANAHGVVLYALEADSRTGGASSVPAGHQGLRMPMHAVRLRENSLDATLTRLAEETGGRAIVDAPDLEAALGGISQDLRHYYSLGFVPEHGGDNARHRLEVRLPGRRGLRVRHRAAYIDKPFEQRLVERVYGVVGLADERNPLGVRVETGEPGPGARGGLEVPVRLWVPLDALTLVPDEGGARGSLRVVLGVPGPDGSLSGVRQKMVPVEVSDGEDEGAPEGTAGAKLVEVGLELPAGRHQIAVAVRDELAGRASFLRHEVNLDAEALTELQR